MYCFSTAFFVGAIGDINNLSLRLWYLDDGAFVGSRDDVSTLVKSIV